ncbi:MAG: hypothetical protein ACE5PM_09225 [Candidatus Hydrothermarchaeales archaeon]
MDRGRILKIIGIAFEVFVVVVFLYFASLYASEILSHPSEIFASSLYQIVIVLGILILIFIVLRIYLKKEGE